MKFKNKVVLITGGSRGIGKATAITFAKEGASIALNYRSDTESAMQTMEELTGNTHIQVQADIGDPNAVQELVEKVVQHYGKIDVLVNNAGIFEYHPIDEVDYYTWQRNWQRTLNINLIAAANLMYCVAQYMMKKGAGKIINVSSRGAFRGEPLQPAYGASKAGMNAMGQSLAQALAKYNISVCTVAPGFVETDMATAVLEGPDGESIRKQSPFGRVARPEEVAAGILFFASEEATFMSGAVLDINGASYLRT